ncbi:MAG TPA: DNA primase [Thermomicrobiales bacterium]|nr:DNA primase [Thermomicrobiales bacterium]
MARDAVAEIRERIDVVDLVQSYVPSLKKTGRNYKGLCPFHQEKTPSFIVFPDSQNFHCFGCGKGGDIFTFFMLVENIEFRDALRDLARRAGVELEIGAPPQPEHDAHRHRLIEVNELAATFFHHVLTNSSHGAAGRQVISDRGVSPGMIERFKLGFAPDGWDGLLNFLASRDVSGELAADAGLAQVRDNGGFYDRFRHRLMFPIRDREGNTIGFGGRALGDAMPKYLNSPQTAIFDKSTIVYALDLAREPIRKASEVVIVEGYMDVIAAHQFGYENVVASMGTALTEYQVQAVKRGADRIVLALDSDAAGQMATLRGIETMRDSLDGELLPTPDAAGIIRFERKLKTEIAVVQLPSGKDPDELIRRAPQTWPEIVATARPFMDFTIDTLTSSVDLSNARQKSEIVTKIAPLLQQIPDRIVQGHYVTMLARRLGLDDRLVLAEVRKAGINQRPSAQRAGVSPEAVQKVARRSTEDYVVALFLRHPGLTSDVLNRIPIEEVTDVRNRELIRVLREEDLSDLTPEQIVIGLDDELADHAERLLNTLEGRPEQFPGQIHKESEEMLMKLGKERFTFLMRQLDITLKQALVDNDRDALNAVKVQIGQLAERHRQYYPPPSPYFLDSRSPVS